MSGGQTFLPKSCAKITPELIGAPHLYTSVLLGNSRKVVRPIAEHLEGVDIFRMYTLMKFGGAGNRPVFVSYCVSVGVLLRPQWGSMVVDL